jgi:hypothetical protein
MYNVSIDYHIVKKTEHDNKRLGHAIAASLFAGIGVTDHNPPLLLAGSRVDYFFLWKDRTVTMRLAKDKLNINA